ncbi:hypothetical protein [Thermus sp.]|uniref:hypothetical protein n=1 Tax=Thermus sp. TaxID=275 RepID=UPI002638E3EC|nr:hypothetical protein [Thermus sp.]MCX7849664.1 hypothetical protein [Thermus sp.]
MDVLNQILSLLGNPQSALSLMPNPASWPVLMQDAMRSYRVHEIAYWVGILFLLLGAASSVLSYMIQTRGAKVFFNLLLVGVLWGGLVTRPENDCLPGSGYPCVVQKEVYLENPNQNTAWTRVRYAKETLDFSRVSAGAGGQYVLRDRDRQIQVVEEVGILPPYIRYEYKHSLGPIWSRVEGLWWTLSSGANASLMASLLSYQKEIVRAREQLLSLVKTTFAINAAGTLADALAQTAVYHSLMGAKDFKGALKGLAGVSLAGAATQSLGTGIAVITELFKTLAVILALAPLAMILTYGFVVSMAGFTFYLIVFTFPIFVGLGALFGAQTVAFPLRLLLVSLLVPVLVSPLVGASVHMTYGYNAALQQFLETSAEKGLLKEIPMKDDPVSAYAGATIVQIAAKQLHNTYLCLKPYFQREGSRFVYRAKYDEGPVKYPDGNIATCYADQGRLLAHPVRHASPVSLDSLATILALPLSGGTITGNWNNLERFFADLAAYTNDGTATMLDLTSPLKLQQMRRLINRYGLAFSLPFPFTNMGSVLAKGMDKLGPDVAKTFTPARIEAALGKLGTPMDPASFQKSPGMKEGLGQFLLGKGNEECQVGGQGTCKASSPPEVLYILDRFLLANRMGLDDTLLGTGGLAQTALSVLVSTLVSLVLSLIVIGATWNMMGMVFGATVRAGDTVIEAPGLGGFAGLMNFGGSVYRRR